MEDKELLILIIIWIKFILPQVIMKHTTSINIEKKTAKREKFKVTIGGLHATKRGKQSVCAHYKYDSSKLTGLQLLSLPGNVDIN